MHLRIFAGVAALALGLTFTSTPTLSQTATPAGKPQSPDWFLSVPGAGGSSGGHVETLDIKGDGHREILHRPNRRSCSGLPHEEFCQPIGCVQGRARCASGPSADAGVF